MHLDHKIPWNTLAGHFNLERFSSHNPSLNAYPDIYCRALPSQAKDLNHFLQTLIATIREFSMTERAKYPAAIPTTSSSQSQKLFSDELLAYPERKYGLDPYKYGRRTGTTNPLCTEHQKIDYWIRMAQVGRHRREDKPGYGENEDLADALKMLITIASLPSKGKAADEDKATKTSAREAFSAILQLTHNPQTPIHELYWLGWGGDCFGVNFVVERAFQAYLLINLVDAIRSREEYAAVVATAAKKNRTKHSAEQQKPKISLPETRSFHVWADNALEYDGSKAENIPHRAFWDTCGITHQWANRTRYAEKWIKDYRTGPDHWHYANVLGEEHYQNVRDPLAPSEADAADVQRSELQQYLKLCFGIMYRFDLWCREWQGDAETDAMWETEIIYHMSDIWQCKIGEEDAKDGNGAVRRRLVFV